MVISGDYFRFPTCCPFNNRIVSLKRLRHRVAKPCLA
ncbi:hypothetical protein CGRA01v4_03657 [Colletotrichum graminicola]|nr:hypothetical protein CGRA01v4_03657 [Colletotrichum graminicola]